MLLVEPEFKPVPLGVEAALAGAPGLLLPEVPVPVPVPLDPLSAPVLVPAPVPPALPGVVVPLVALGEEGVEPSTELDVPVELAPSLPVPRPMVDEPGAPVPAPGSAGAEVEPAGLAGSCLRSQALSVLTARATKAVANQKRVPEWWRVIKAFRMGCGAIRRRPHGGAPAGPAR